MKIENINPNILWAILGIFSLLIIASVTIFILIKVKPKSDFSNLKQRIKSWWIMILIFTSAIVVSRSVSYFFFGFLSFMALKEYLTLIPTRRADRIVLFFIYISIPIQYYFIYIGWYGMFIVFIPVYMFLFLPICMVLIGETSGFLHSAGVLNWGLMTTVFSISHGSYLLSLPAQNNPNGGGAGLLVFLVFLTQLNDVSQFLWGKALGKRKVVPKVSPGKTWAGFAGGVVTTSLLAYLAAPVLTPFTPLHSILIGMLISIAGFFGDLSISALKRDLNIKDSGTLIPGHGGILDRVDSMTYTAPLFFHIVYYMYF